MRASWVGAIHFGLVAIPVRLWRAVREHYARLRYLHRPCRTPVVLQPYCPYHERMVARDEVVRGYEIAPGQFVEVEADELAAARATEMVRSRRIEIQSFVDLAEIDPLFFAASYYAEPLPEGRPAYGLLRQAMQQTARVAIARLALRQRERFAAIRPYEDALVVHTLHFADEVRSPATLGLPAEAADARELRTAMRLIEALAEPFAPARLQDEFQRRLLSRIEERTAEQGLQPVLQAEGQAAPSLAGELEASIRLTRRGRDRSP